MTDEDETLNLESTLLFLILLYSVGYVFYSLI